MTETRPHWVSGPFVSTGARRWAAPDWPEALPETLGEGPVVFVATAEEVALWARTSRSGVTWVVMGEGTLPGEARIFQQFPVTVGPAVVAAAANAARESLHLHAKVARLESEVAQAATRHAELVRVGAALTAERNLDRLLELILSTARGLVNADAGSLYLVERPDRKDLTAGRSRSVLRFELAQNDSVSAPFLRQSIPVDGSSLAGFVATTGQTVRVGDVREIDPDSALRFNARFDEASGYQTRSLLATPMATRGGEVIGVLQLINRKADPGVRCSSADWPEGAVVPFDAGDAELIQALAALAAVALENSRLVQEVEGLFEGFVRASVLAIEQRDPSTSGHSLRVAHSTVALARLVEQVGHPDCGAVRFSRDELTQLRYAALLHDFGKVGVREAVLTKARKLYPERLSLIQERFRHAFRAHEAGLLRRLVGDLAATERPPAREDLAALDRDVAEVRSRLDEIMALILRANEPTVLEAECSELLEDVASEVFLGPDDEALSLVWPEEAADLLVPRGSLNEVERREVESHVVHTFQFLLTLPWPRRFRRVPEIAHGHHEKPSGRGYPNQLAAGEIPLEARIMAVCDVFDALAAGDRPYKRAVSTDRALEILEIDAHSGSLDPHLVKLFVDGKVFARSPDDPAAG